MEKKKFHYDEYGDSLIISNRQENEIVKRNFDWKVIAKKYYEEMK